MQQENSEAQRTKENPNVLLGSTNLKTGAEGGTRTPSALISPPDRTRTTQVNKRVSPAIVASYNKVTKRRVDRMNHLPVIQIPSPDTKSVLRVCWTHPDSLLIYSR